MMKRALTALFCTTALVKANGAAAGPDGSFYYREDAAVRKVDSRGMSTIVAIINRKQ